MLLTLILALGLSSMHYSFSLGNRPTQEQLKQEAYSQAKNLDKTKCIILLTDFHSEGRNAALSLLESANIVSYCNENSSGKSANQG